ncbi:tetratricopeptide repeat protein [Acidiphilium iwatense]|uniref:Tetratricopeptide repeat protein n=1 Tax=Acidiphilium iwatense TaxID=768198 RepID=A0ABS9DW33_9PROT|nr:tetratricopeptide repeat protein [Acidiphilium iwatense]MCF3946958.1 tetratricopeptide repeat protein [Acidiphilium iwatense]
MPDIFDEVADDLRAERTRKFLARYAGAFVAAAVLVLIGIGGWKTWQWYQHRQNVRAATQYMALTDRIAQAGPGLAKAGEIKDAKALVDFAAKVPAGYATLARFRAAALYNAAGDAQSAEALWNRLGASASGAGPILRGLANLLWAQHAMGVTPDATVMARLKPLMAPSNPWHDLAQVNAAVLDMQAGKNAEAKSLLDRVSADPAAPANLRNLAEGLIAKLNG